MICYDFFLYLQGSNASYKYSLNFKPEEEDDPERKFTSEIRESMRRDLEKKSSCKIDPATLNKMIQPWIEDIKEGFRETSMTLDLPSLLTDGLSHLQEQGYQNLPEVIPPDLADIEPQFGCLPPLNFV
jgi:hypothetical protein